MSDEFVQIEFFNADGKKLDFGKLLSSQATQVTYGAWEPNVTDEGRRLNVYRIVTPECYAPYIEFKIGKSIAKCDLDALHLLKTYLWYKLEKRNNAIVSRYYDESGKYMTLWFKRIVMNASKDQCVCHVNKDGLDVRKTNLAFKGAKLDPTAIVPKVVARFAKIVKRESWMGGKPSGSITRKEGYLFQVKFGASPFHSKAFSFSKFDSEAAALKAAEDYRFKVSLERGDVKNRYRHVWDEDGTEYLEVIVQDIIFLCDLADLEHVENHIWHLNDQGYVSTNINKRTVKFHQKVLPGCSSVDHINGDVHDNRRCNLRDGSKGVNGRNRKRNKTNTSGTTGVYYVERDDGWIARWIEDEKPQSKLFTVKVHGDKAKQLAIDVRKAADSRLGLNICQTAQ